MQFPLEMMGKCRDEKQQTFCILVLVFLLMGLADGKTSFPFEGNSTVQQGFLKWVRRMGSLKHSIFHTAKNNFLPSFYITVDKRPGVGDYSSVQDAVDSLPLFNILRVVIKINAGTYKEKVNVVASKAFVTFEGAGADKTVIEWGDNAATPGPDGRPLGTFASASVAINSPYFIAKNITFKNTTPCPLSGAPAKQAVAFRISADTAAFLGCKFLSWQDTLYDHLGRHYFKDCYIEGSVDFIFGNGLSLYEGCHLHAISNALGALTAQKRSSLLEETGFSFVKCKVTGSGVLYLGRAWGTFSRVVFAYTYMDKIIVPKGWYDWGDRTRDLTVFYGQYKCSGGGASFAGRVSWSRELTDDEAKPFIALSFIDGEEWINL
ncbi:probable pectinesterase 53 [Cryptomeria japonica]|uniref:probable pectinesterase 53 n=1 Tax=Cryptomeria japonica TaxID=3369 RepID=UPI0025AC409A|nr:probable pectinesterase 53 [Cryptomeria japonica]